MTHARECRANRREAVIEWQDMLRSIGSVFLSASVLLACGSQPDEAPSPGSAGTSGAQALAGAPATGTSGGALGTSGGALGASGGALGASGGALGSCPPPLATGDVSHLMAMEHEDDYSVMGNTASQLRASINANRGQDYDALTTWNIEWSVKTCATSTWSVALDVSYRLPKWDAPAGADTVLVAQWRSYWDALHCHEYGHGQLGLDCAHRVYDALAALPGNNDCAALSSSAKPVFDDILADCHTREVKYDADTNHGATMGAVFPP